MKPVTLSASLAVISKASKYLHNDLARAIEALEQKKPNVQGNGPEFQRTFSDQYAWPLSESTQIPFSSIIIMGDFVVLLELISVGWIRQIRIVLL